MTGRPTIRPFPNYLGGVRPFVLVVQTGKESQTHAGVGVRRPEEAGNGEWLCKIEAAYL